MFRSDVVSRQSCSNVRGRCTKVIDGSTRGMIGHREWRGWEGLWEHEVGREPGFGIKVFSLIRPRPPIYRRTWGLPHSARFLIGDAGQERRTTV